MIPSSLQKWWSDRKQLPADWGKRKPHRDNLYFEERLFRYKEYAYFLDDATADDLDFNLLFNFVDRTSSIIGQQCLYERLRSPYRPETELHALEDAIGYYSVHDYTDIVLALNKVSRDKDYILPAVLYDQVPQRSRFASGIRALQLTGFALLLFGFNYPLLWLGLLPLLAVNLFIHYYVKSSLGLFTQVFSRLRILHRTADRILPSSHYTEDDRAVLVAANRELKRILRRVDILKSDQLVRNEATTPLWYLAEVVKFVTLLDVAVYNALIRDIDRIRATVTKLYYAIGEVDIALSTLALRRSLPTYCVPDFRAEPGFAATGMYHPILAEPVSNDIAVADKGVLITGSNMSGKSTFVKTVNINVICAQSIHTCFCSIYGSRRYKIATSVNIADAIESGASYYLEEVGRIGRLIRRAAAEGPDYLITIDEVFRGTNTTERIAAASGVLRYLVAHGALTLACTHDTELTTLLSDTFDAYYFQEAVEGSDLSFDYKIKRGTMHQSNALKILEISGYPEEIIGYAQRTAAALRCGKLPPPGPAS